MDDFPYEPSRWVPFRDGEVLQRVRNIRRKDIETHSNPDFRIRVVPDADVDVIWVTDVVHRIYRAREEGRRLVVIFGNPNPSQRHIARLINRLRIPCDHLHVFIMDEYADEDGRVAPETWPQSFMRAFKSNFYRNLDEALRPPEAQIHGPTTENIDDYGKIIADMGGADACYSGPGWTGHLAFIEPDAPEFDADIETWKRMGPRIVTLSPFTIAQNSLHGHFGQSGDLAAVPPKAATIGPAEVIGAHYRMERHALRIDGSDVSWQRFISRLIIHGPVTPRVPTSVHQLLKTDCYVSETIAADIEPRWDREY